jgi:hypothetical protein
MARVVNISEAFLEQTDFEAGLEKVLASVPYAVFCCDSAHIYLFCVEEFEYLSERLSRFVLALKSGVLLLGLVASLVKCQLFAGVRLQILMDVSAACACNAVRRPYASLLLEG